MSGLARALRTSASSLATSSRGETGGGEDPLPGASVTGDGKARQKVAISGADDTGAGPVKGEADHLVVVLDEEQRRGGAVEDQLAFVGNQRGGAPRGHHLPRRRRFRTVGGRGFTDARYATASLRGWRGRLQGSLG